MIHSTENSQLLLTREQLDTLCAGGHIKIDTPLLFWELQHLINNGMVDLSTDPNRHAWSTDSARTDGGDPDKNYILRTGADKDAKHIFQYRNATEQEITAAGITCTETQTKMLNAMYEMHIWSMNTAKILWGQLRNHLKETYGMSISTDIDVGSSLLRSLYYLPEKEFYAEPHIDLGLLTIAFPDMDTFGKPSPGLIMPGMTKPYKHSNNKALVFLGGKASMLTLPYINKKLLLAEDLKDAVLQPALHGAVRNTSHQPRFTQVYFAHCDVGLDLDELGLLFKEYYVQRARELSFYP
ncbi:MAG: hypothetical protein LRY41_02670 [Candidatus Pacebacteria bacterium]|nr:hypothetical protein [Candidatus Paceibacterota bacterium]MCD8508067.1 hypothetical protein [Candidatus Paceibacterota bacterium]MCD8528201.1 hypothetical protein [Candidatus Paceibacterota bacterium]MCD8563840.1 hypothetical protein [Candidatus Paceibacterota bacterium]